MPNRTILSLLSIMIVLNSFAQEPPPDTSRSADRVFTKVEIDASYPGGDRAWVSYLQKNLKADVPMQNGAPLGLYRVIVKFIVSKDGFVTNIQPETKWGYGTEQEVTRILQNSGKWLPASQDGRFVNAYRRQPVTFMVEEDGFNIHTSAAGDYLYTGVDNPLIIDIAKVKNKDLKLSISQGTITASEDGQFIARVTKPGRAVITIYSVKKDKELAQAGFEVKAKK